MRLFKPSRDEFRKAAFERYAGIRCDAYEVTMRYLETEQALHAHLLPDIQLVDINQAALEAAEAWPVDDRMDDGGWSWTKAYRNHASHSRFFPPAVWHQGALCGLALGRITRGKLFLRVNLMQGNPVSNTLKGDVAFILLTAAEFYADGAGVATVTIERPMEGVVPHYEDYGYELKEDRGEYRMVKELPESPD